MKSGIFLFYVACILTLSAQEVVNLRTASKDRLVYLSWLPSPQLVSYKVYRSSSPISVQTISQAFRIGLTAKGMTEFADIVTDPGAYYYAALPNVGPTDPDTILTSNSPVIVTNPSAQTKGAVMVRRLKAYITSSGILLNFTADNSDRSFTLFRSHEPILTIENLKKAKKIEVRSGAQLQIIDRPPAGVPVYYSLHDSKLLSKQLTPILLNENTLSSPITFLLSESAEQMIPEAEYRSPVAPYPTLFVARDDLEMSSDPKRQQLRSILMQYFLKNQYTNSIKALEDLLKTYPPEDTSQGKYRVYLYIGQSYFALNHPKESLISLITAQEDLSFYPEIEKFIDAILEAAPDLFAPSSN